MADQLAWLAEHAEWLAGRIEARIWWCGDDVCDCTEAQILRIVPNLATGPPWVRIELLWGGEFITGAYELTPTEYDQRVRQPLRAACTRFGLPFPERYEAMSWQGHGHTGGVKGTKLARADCPVCGRDTAGGNCNRERTQIMLKPHRRVDVARRGALRPWCPGGRAVVTWR